MSDTIRGTPETSMTKKMKTKQKPCVGSFMGEMSIENIRESKKIRVKRLRPVYQGP